MGGAVMGPSALHIDLRGKSLEEVMGLLTNSGFRVLSVKTDMWDTRERILHGRTEDGPPVHVIWMDNAEAPLLTVIIFNGKEINLKPGMDLHLFNRPDDHVEPEVQDWSAFYTLDVMR